MAISDLFLAGDEDGDDSLSLPSVFKPPAEDGGGIQLLTPDELDEIALVTPEAKAQVASMMPQQHGDQFSLPKPVEEGWIWQDSGKRGVGDDLYLGDDAEPPQLRGQTVEVTKIEKAPGRDKVHFKATEETNAKANVIPYLFPGTLKVRLNGVVKMPDDAPRGWAGETVRVRNKRGAGNKWLLDVQRLPPVGEAVSAFGGEGLGRRSPVQLGVRWLTELTGSSAVEDWMAGGAKAITTDTINMAGTLFDAIPEGWDVETVPFTGVKIKRAVSNLRKNAEWQKRHAMPLDPHSFGYKVSNTLTNVGIDMGVTFATGGWGMLPVAAARIYDEGVQEVLNAADAGTLPAEYVRRHDKDGDGELNEAELSAASKRAGVQNLPGTLGEFLGDVVMYRTLGGKGKFLKGRKDKALFAGLVATPAVEAMTEGAQTAWTNYVASELTWGGGYDPERGLGDGVLESMALGVITGGTVSVVGTSNDYFKNRYLPHDVDDFQDRVADVKIDREKVTRLLGAIDLERAENNTDLTAFLHEASDGAIVSASGRLSRGEEPAQKDPALTRDEVTDAISDQLGNMGENAPNVVVFDDVSQIEDNAVRGALRAAISQRDVMDGAYVADTKTVYLHANDIHSVEQANKVLAHEAIGHHGVEVVTGPLTEKFYLNVISEHGPDAQNPEGSKEWQEVLAENPGYEGDPMTIAKEIGAAVAEKPENFDKSLATRLGAFVRRAIGKDKGVDMSRMTDNEIVRAVNLGKRLVEHKHALPSRKLKESKKEKSFLGNLREMLSIMEATPAPMEGGEEAKAKMVENLRGIIAARERALSYSGQGAVDLDNSLPGPWPISRFHNNPDGIYAARHVEGRGWEVHQVRPPGAYASEALVPIEGEEIISNHGNLQGEAVNQAEELNHQYRETRDAMGRVARLDTTLGKEAPPPDPADSSPYFIRHDGGGFRVVERDPAFTGGERVRAAYETREEAEGRLSELENEWVKKISEEGPPPPLPDLERNALLGPWRLGDYIPDDLLKEVTSPGDPYVKRIDTETGAGRFVVALKPPPGADPVSGPAKVFMGINSRGEYVVEENLGSSEADAMVDRLNGIYRSEQIARRRGQPPKPPEPAGLYQVVRASDDPSHPPEHVKTYDTLEEAQRASDEYNYDVAERANLPAPLFGDPLPPDARPYSVQSYTGDPTFLEKLQILLSGADQGEAFFSRLSPDFFKDSRIEAVFEAWRAITDPDHEKTFTLDHVKDLRDLVQLTETMGGGRVEVRLTDVEHDPDTGEVKDESYMFHDTRKGGEIGITRTVDALGRSNIFVGSTQGKGAPDSEKKMSSGKLLYQIVFQWAHNNGYRVHGSGLTGINRFRRPINMESSVLANQSSEHLVPFVDSHGGEQIIDVKNWAGRDNQSLVNDWRHDAIRLLLTNARKAHENVPGIEELSYDIDAGVFRRENGEVATDKDFEAAVRKAFPNKGFGNDKGLGLTTLKRAVITASAFAGPFSIDRMAKGMTEEQGAVTTTGILASGKGVSRDHAAAVERGDMAAAQALVDEAAKAAGYDSPPLFHGRPQGAGFTVFDPDKTGANTGYPDTQVGPAFFFSTNGATAALVGGHGEKGEAGVGAGQPWEHVKAYLKLENPIDWTWDRDEGGDFINTENLAAIIKAARAQGRDGVIYRNTEMGDTYIAFTPEQIKSSEAATYDDAGNLIPLSERFDLESPDIRFSGKGAKLTKAQQGASLIETLYGDEAPAKPGSRSKEEVARLVQERTLKAYGGKVLEEGPEDDGMSEVMVAEALAAMDSDGPDAALWYDEDVDRGVAAVAVKHPEIIDDLNARSMFLLGLAITSNGQTVGLNAKYGLLQYERFKETGRFYEAGWGQEKGSMIKAFKLANRLLKKHGPAKMKEFLSNDFTVGALQKAGYKISGEHVDVQVKGSAIFGPKIGQGFYQNLNKNFEPITIDMWLMRTWGRLTGDLIGKPHLVEKGRNRLIDALTLEGKVADGVPLETIEERRAARKLGYRVSRDNVAKPTNKRPAPEVRFSPEDVPPADGVNAAGETLTQFARKVQNKYNKVYEKHSKAFQAKAKTKAESALAASSIVKQQGSPKDVPANGAERKRIRRVMRKALAMLKEAGHDLTPAQLQAVLWFPEKQLYQHHGVRVADVNMSYRGAFEQLMGQQGVTDEQIEGAWAVLSTSEWAGRESAGRDVGQRDLAVGEELGPVGGTGVAQPEILASGTGAVSSLTGEGKFAARLVEDSAVHAAVKAGIKVEYEVLANSEVFEEAYGAVFRINEQGGREYREDAPDRVRDEDNDMSGPARVAAGMILMRRWNVMIDVAERANDVAGMDANAEMAWGMADWLSTYGRGAGRIVQMYTNYSILHPYTLRKKAKQIIGQVATRNVKAEGMEAETEAIIVGLREASAKAATQSTEGESIKKSISRAVRASLRGGGNALWGRYRRSAVTRIMSALRVGGRSRERAAPLKEFTNRLISEAKARLREQGIALTPAKDPNAQRKADLDLLEEMMKDEEHYAEVWEKVGEELDALAQTDPDAADAVREVFGEVTRDPSGRVIAGVVKDVLTEMGEEIPALVRQHYLKKDATAKKLARSIMGELANRDVEMSEQQALSLAKKIEAEYRALLKKAAKTELDRIVAGSRKRGMRRVRKTASDKLIELVNLGAFEDEEAYNAVAEGLGLPSYDKKWLKKIEKLADEVQKAPEGSPKTEKTLDFMNAIHSRVGESLMDILFAVRFANMLSGFTTQQINFMSTLENMTFGLASQALRLRNPMAIARMFVSVFRGLKTGGKEAVKVLKTGRGRKGVALTRFRQDHVLERWTAPGGKLNPINWLKWVTRGMAANDALFRYAASEGKAFVLAYNLGRKDGLKGAELRQAIETTLKLEETSQADAVTQATGEGFHGIDRARRVDEIIHMSRDPELQTLADEFGSLAAFQQDPQGWIGVLAKKLNEVANPRRKPGELPEEGVRVAGVLAKFFIPFIYTLANVGNLAIDFTPGWGYLRNHMRRRASKLGKVKPIGNEDLTDQLYRAHLGTLSMMALYAMLEDAWDDDDPWLEVYGPGPSNRSHREKLRKRGQLHPFSIKLHGEYINTLETPLSIPLAFFGYVFDQRRYGGNEEEQMERIISGGIVAVNAWTNMNFVRSVDEAFDVLTLGDIDEAKRKAKDIFSFGFASFVQPNILRQLDRVFDPRKTSINDLNSMYQQSVAFARRKGHPDLDMYGQDVMKMGGTLWQRFGNRIIRATAPEDPTVTLMARHGVYPPAIGKQSWLERNGKKNYVSPMERYAWQKLAGHELQRRMEKGHAEMLEMDREAFEKRLMADWSDSREWAKAWIESSTDGDLEKYAKLPLKKATAKKIPPPDASPQVQPQPRRRSMYDRRPPAKQKPARKRTALEWLKSD